MFRLTTTTKALPILPLVKTTFPFLSTTTLISNRFQTTTTTTADKSEPFSDEDINEWLQTIRKARLNLRQNSLDKSLLLSETIDINGEEEFTPTEQQIQEYEALKDVPLPLRKDPVLEHVTNMIMRHGKKQVAERIMSRALHLVYCQTRKDPVELLKKSLDEMAPLMVVKTFSTKVAKSAVIPVPLNQRQRNRIAWKWIVEGANKRVSSDFAVRLGEELVAVSKGIGSGFDKRDQIHKMAIAHRAYIKLK
ncbi:mitochondrial 37S ribosomal protein uS7m RSM7 PWA37_003619 [Arxiozyma heterogenica]|uniref:mitochondrial 37S ribosomal protein uS7m RSM7 n=1 Tax=Arxiozyma heterogenica TaxID=278026 RepID=UPI002EE3994A